MLNRTRRVMRQLRPHEHRWVTQRLGGGLERSVCDRCGGVHILGVRPPSLRQESAARRLLERSLATSSSYPWAKILPRNLAFVR